MILQSDEINRFVISFNLMDDAHLIDRIILVSKAFIERHFKTETTAGIKCTHPQMTADE
jgi:hypothetical protein